MRSESQPELAVDGRVLNDRHPGVRDFWVPILRSWALRGGRGLLLHQHGVPPQRDLVDAGFDVIAVSAGPRNPLASPACSRLVRRSGAAVTLSPLYSTLRGATHNLGTVFDLTGRTDPKSVVSRVLWEIVMWRTMRLCSLMLCGSKAAAEEIESSFPAARGRMVVLPAVGPPAPRPDARVLNGLGLSARYALGVASHRPHKRLRELAEAWTSARTALPLVLVGHGTQVLDKPPVVRGFGYLCTRKREAMLAGAACLVSASRAEGFGLPVLAALAAQIPVIATRQAALEELAGEAATWRERDDLVGLARAAEAVAADPASAELRGALGKARAAAFTEERAARALADLLATMRSGARTTNSPETNRRETQLSISS